MKIKWFLMTKQKKICLIFLLIVVIFFYYFLIEMKKINNIHICICTLGKLENKYIREYIEHYEKYGVDKIYLYDNNDLNGEKFEEVIIDYINKGFVEILNWRGIRKGIHKLMNDCYNRNYRKFDWLIFYELDEFINLYNYTSIKTFLNEKRFENCQLLYLNSISHTDNNLLYYDNRSLAERFPKTVPLKKNMKLGVKFIIRGHINNVKINKVHIGSKRLINCNSFGHKNKVHGNHAIELDFRNYIDHYYCKSTEEFIFKINRGDILNNSTTYFMHKVKKYFLQNKITKKKIEMIEKGTGLNLSIYKKKLNLN